MKFLKKNSLIDRYKLGEVSTSNIWFRYGSWSVMDCGELNKTHPFPDGLFSGWEAMRKNKIIRANTLKSLLKKL